MTSPRYKWHSCSKDDFPFKRQKVPKACQLCRQKKMRCDGLNPCDRCTRHNLKCRYDEESRRPSLLKAIDQISNSDPGSHTSTKLEYSKGNEQHNYHNQHQQQKLPPRSTTVPPPSPSPSPSPMQQQQPQLRNHHSYCRANLDRISFANNVYEAMRQCRSSNAITRSYLFASQTPPLMFDFFNLTSQPYRIWSAFIMRFTDFLHRPQQDKSKELAQEIVDLFTNFNLLYSPLFDFGLLSSHITPGLLMKDPAPDTTESMVLYAIFALVLHAAFQTLSTSRQELAPSLEEHANIFHQEAQRRFLKITFGPPSQDLDRASLMNLMRVAILLTHYNCAAVSEESAYMTLRVGLGYANRCSLPAFVKDMSTSRGSRSSNSNVLDVDAAERKRLRGLFKVLKAWHTWLSFYLHRGDWMIEDNAVLQAETSYSTGITPSALRKMMDDKNSSDKHARQRWAIHAAEAYTEFLRQISRGPTDLVNLQHQLQTLQALSIPPSEKAAPDKKDETLLTSPACILSLYHHILTIQLFFCQVPESQTFFLHREQALIGQPPTYSDKQVPDNNLMLNLCDAAAAEIVHIIDLLTAKHQASLSGHKSNSDLTGSTTGSGRQPEPIAHAIFYPICFAASITVFCLRLRQPSSNDKNSGRAVPQESPDLSAAKTALPIYKLQRLLSPISSQMELANMIPRPFDEIQAEVKSSSALQVEQPITATSVTAMVVAEEQRPVSTIAYTHATTSATPIAATLQQHQHAQYQQQQQQQQQLQRQRGMRPPPVEQFWTDSAFDHALQDDQVLLAETAISARGMAYPVLDVMNRNDVDREQLNKLTSKKDLTTTTATMTTHAPPPPPPSTDLCSIYFASRQRMTQAGMIQYPHGQKRQQQPQQQLQEQQQEIDPAMMQHVHKKMRHMAPNQYGSFMSMDLVRTPRRVSYPQHHHHHHHHQHHQHAINNGNSGGVGGGGSSGSSNNTSIPPDLQNTMGFPMISDEYLIYEQMKMGETPPTPELLLTNIFGATTTPRLPPPKQRRPQGVTMKNWAGREKETEAFHGSMMETLHTVTVQPSGTVAMMDPMLVHSNTAAASGGGGGGNGGASGSHGHGHSSPHPGPPPQPPGSEQPPTMAGDPNMSDNMLFLDFVNNEAERLGWDNPTLTRKRAGRAQGGLRPTAAASAAAAAAAAAAVTARSTHMYNQDQWIGM